MKNEKYLFFLIINFILATYNENLEIVELLLNNNADLNLTDDNGCTALHIGNFFYSSPVLYLLLVLLR